MESRISADTRDTIVDEAMVKSRLRRNRKIITWLMVLIVVLAFMSVTIFAFAYRKIDNQAKVATALAEDLVAVCQEPNPNRTARGYALCRQANVVVNDAPKTTTQPKTGARGLPGLPGPSGIPGVDGVDGKDGAAGVGKNGTNGTNGKNGATGKTGASGTDGKDGIDGKDGATGPTGDAGPKGEPGPQGPAGPEGPRGADGSAGTDGRGIASVRCGDEGQFVVEYTDGTSQAVAGSDCDGLVP